jgi:hypothetical protein
MTGFEYKVVPAPLRGLKGKGIKGTPARFANALQLVMNDLGAQGWEYQRTDTLPVEERVGLTKKSTSFQNMLVFRRTLEIKHADAPEVAALIEDQTSVIEDTDAAKPDIEIDHVAAQDQGSTSEEPRVKTTEVIDGPVSLATKDRVSETLTAPFAFPWDKRRTRAQAPKDDDSYLGSEQ